MNLRISASSDITLTNRDAIARFERCVRIVNYVNAAIETGSRAGIDLFGSRRTG